MRTGRLSFDDLMMKALTSYKLHFGTQVRLKNIWVKVEYQGHAVKVKVLRS